MLQRGVSGDYAPGVAMRRYQSAPRPGVPRTVPEAVPQSALAASACSAMAYLARLLASDSFQRICAQDTRILNGESTGSEVRCRWIDGADAESSDLGGGDLNCSTIPQRVKGSDSTNTNSIKNK